MELKIVAVLIMKNWNGQTVEEIKLLSLESFNTLGETENDEYFVILEADASGDKGKNKKINLLETKICSRNLIKGINT